jgi:hypothetical protein
MPTDHDKRLLRLQDPIASRTLLCVRPSGDVLTVSIKIARPYADGNSFRCPVAIEPLYDRFPDIGGTDSWQSVQLAMRLVDNLLRDEVERGGKFFWPDDTDAGKPGEPYTPD